MDVTVTLMCRARGYVADKDQDLVVFSSPDHHIPEVKLHVQVPTKAPFRPGERYEVSFRHDPYLPAAQRPGYTPEPETAGQD